MRGARRFVYLALLVFTTWGLQGCTVREFTLVESHASTPLDLFASLTGEPTRRLAGGMVEVTFTLFVGGAASYRFTPSLRPPIVFDGESSYSKVFPMTKAIVSESGTLECLDAGGRVIESKLLETGPILLDGELEEYEGL